MFFILHILLMATATLGIIAGVSAAIFFRKKKNWLKIHKTFNSFSVLRNINRELLWLLFMFPAQAANTLMGSIKYRDVGFYSGFNYYD